MLYFPEIDIRRTPVTLVLGAVTAALAMLEVVDSGRHNAIVQDWAVWYLMWAGEFWRPLTTTMIHADVLHAAFNIYLLILWGVTIEERLGPARTAGLITLLAYTSSLCQYDIRGYFDIRHTAVGLSGVVYGLFGILWVGSRYKTEYAYVCTPVMVRIMMAWFFLCIVLTAVGALPVANIAHAAGLLFGLLIGLAMFQKRRRVLWVAVLSFASALVLATLIGLPGHDGFEYVRARNDWWAAKWFR